MYNVAYHNKDLSKLSFLITGGAGFIGSHLVEYLLKYGAGGVRVLDNLSTGKKENVELFISHPKYQFIEGDIRDLQICKQACENIDIVFHEAALGSVPRSVIDPITSHEVNADGTLNMLVATRDCKVKRFIYASSSSIYGDQLAEEKTEDLTAKPISPYAVSKHTGELYTLSFAQTYFIETIALRYFNVFGPRQSPDGPYAAVIPRFIDSVKKNESPTIYGDGNQTRDFTFVENVVQANIKAALTSNPDALNHVYNIACHTSFSVNKLLEMINKILNKNVEAIYQPERKGDIVHSLADIKKAEKFLNYHVEIPMYNGLENSVF
jgi:UDP-N-acetylglucosamine/UDP-N-acetylgalactosamine 4-epimerase